jgi:PAS domain S-box-containing protein
MASNDQELLAGARKQFNNIFEKSAQAIYIYRDDVNKVCNKKFASLLGYSSPEEWAAVKENFPDAFVAKESQQTLIRAYQAAMEKFVGSTNRVVWRTKDGKPVQTTTILVPIIHEGEAMALHFVSPE